MSNFLTLFQLPNPELRFSLLLGLCRGLATLENTDTVKGQTHPTAHTESMREAIMRLSKRKRKQDVNKDLFDALLERNCILRFTHYLHKLDTTGKSVHSLNFWLDSRMYTVFTLAPLAYRFL